jgi:hypothetical protein
VYKEVHTRQIQGGGIFTKVEFVRYCVEYLCSPVTMRLELYLAVYGRVHVILCNPSLLINMRGGCCCNYDDIATDSQGKTTYCQDPGATGVAVWGGAPVVMPRGCRLRLNLVTKDRVSVVVCDQCNFISVDSIVVPLCGD